MWPPCALTLGVMLLVMQKARCCWMLSILWQCCCLVVLRYFCRARAMDGKMACAASRGSITSPGAFFCSSSCMRLICVNASSTATTSLGGKKTQKTKLGVSVQSKSTWHHLFGPEVGDRVEPPDWIWPLTCCVSANLAHIPFLLALFLVSTNSWEKYLVH